MKYGKLVTGQLVRKVNRFIAEVTVNGETERVHIKNTGRLTELMQPGTAVLMETGLQPQRKTRYSLIAAAKDGQWVNIDSLAPNKLVYEAIRSGSIPEIGQVELLRREVTYESSRFDLYFESGGRKGYIEVKGVTLEKEGIASFPDAPTLRGTRHVLEMMHAVQAGYLGVILFVVQMQGCRAFTPHREMDPVFADALRQAVQSGVEVLVYDALMDGEELLLGGSLPVIWEEPLGE